jgi:hypothetical protein
LAGLSHDARQRAEQHEEIQIGPERYGGVVEVPRSLDFGPFRPLIECHLRKAFVAENHGHRKDAFYRRGDGPLHVVEFRHVSAQKLDVASRALDLADESIIFGANPGAPREVDQLAGAMLDHPGGYSLAETPKAVNHLIGGGSVEGKALEPLVSSVYPCYLGSVRFDSRASMYEPGLPCPQLFMKYVSYAENNGIPEHFNLPADIDPHL